MDETIKNLMKDICGSMLQLEEIKERVQDIAEMQFKVGRPSLIVQGFLDIFNITQAQWAAMKAKKISDHVMIMPGILREKIKAWKKTYRQTATATAT